MSSSSSSCIASSEEEEEEEEEEIEVEVVDEDDDEGDASAWCFFKKSMSTISNPTPMDIAESAMLNDGQWYDRMCQSIKSTTSL